MWKQSVKDIDGEILCGSLRSFASVDVQSPNLLSTLSLRKDQSLISTVCIFLVIDTLESMKGPEAKELYGHVLNELGKGLPGGMNKVKG
jgi:hypothetical protein